MGGTAVDTADNNQHIDLSIAAKADVEPENVVILNTSGYLAVAVKVQTVFKGAIGALKVQLDAAKEAEVESEEERAELLEEIDILSEKLAETKRLLEDTEKELAEKIALYKRPRRRKASFASKWKRSILNSRILKRKCVV